MLNGISGIQNFLNCSESSKRLKERCNKLINHSKWKKIIIDVEKALEASPKKNKKIGKR